MPIQLEILSYIYILCLGPADVLTSPLRKIDSCLTGTKLVFSAFGKNAGPE